MRVNCPTFDEALRSLCDDPAAWPWQTRLELAKQTVAALGSRKAAPSALPLFKLLARDPKWEVRKEVADHLQLLSEEEFAAVATPLMGDDNAFVKRSAEQALARRRRGEVSELKRKRGLDRVQSDLRRLEQFHGEPAARMADQIARRLYEVLVGTTVHEMRGMLTSVKAHTETLLRATETDTAAQTCAKIVPRIRDRVLFMERLLDDMRTYTQTLPRERRREKIAELVGDALDLVREEIGAAGRDAAPVELETDVSETLFASVSRIQMVLALKNLVKNAYESLAINAQRFRAGTVRIAAMALDDETLELVISDNGTGLGAADLEEVRQFLPGKTSKKYLGTGFGLPIARRNIEEHAGTIAIDSTAGQGTTITVRLPVEAGKRRTG
jgi:methyl-accepting chemotaxis protein